VNHIWVHVHPNSSQNQRITIIALITCICLFLNDLEESSNLGRRQNRGPESNTADVELPLHAPPTSEFTAIFCPRCVLTVVVSFVPFKFRLCTRSPKSEAQEAGSGSRQAAFQLSADSREQSPVPERWHHAAVLAGAVRVASRPQVGEHGGSGGRQEKAHAFARLIFLHLL